MFILVILYIREYLCVFTKLLTGTRVSGSQNNRKRTSLDSDGTEYANISSDMS